MARITPENIEKVVIAEKGNGDIEVRDPKGNCYENAQILIGDSTHRYIQLKRNGLYGLVDSKSSYLVVDCVYTEMQLVKGKRLVQARKQGKLLGIIPFPQNDMIFIK